MESKNTSMVNMGGSADPAYLWWDKAVQFNPMSAFVGTPHMGQKRVL
jgi:hypothetical protein